MLSSQKSESLLVGRPRQSTVLSTTVLRLTSDTSAADSVPDVGGGTANIASLTGKGSVPTGGPNAAAPVVTATFWIEQVRDQLGGECLRSCSTHNVCCCISKARVGPTSQSRHLDCLCAVKGSLRRRYGELSPSDDCELGADSARAPVNGVIGTASRKANLVWPQLLVWQKPQRILPICARISIRLKIVLGRCQEGDSQCNPLVES
jgi:hypothetical protein